MNVGDIIQVRDQRDMQIAVERAEVVSLDDPDWPTIRVSNGALHFECKVPAKCCEPTPRSDTT